MRLGKKPRIWLVPSLLFLVVLLVACGSPSGTTTTPSTTHTKAPQSQQVLLSGAEGGASDISTFDPGLVADAFSSYAIDNVFVGMIQLNDQGQVYCELC